MEESGANTSPSTMSAENILATMDTQQTKETSPDVITHVVTQVNSRRIVVAKPTTLFTQPVVRKVNSRRIDFVAKPTTLLTQPVNLVVATPVKRIGNLLDPKTQRAKVKEKRCSAVKHFDYYMELKNKELLSDQKQIVISQFSDIKFADIDTGDYLGEYANYLADHATRYCKKDANQLALQTAQGYMGSIKNLLLDQFTSQQRIPRQLQAETWKRYMDKMKAKIWGRCRKDHKPLRGSTQAATQNDRFAMFAICIWDGTLHNAEFINFFQSMVMNCGRGCEIGLTKISHLKMRTIKEPNGLEFDTLEQYVNRTKTQSKFFIAIISLNFLTQINFILMSYKNII